jgi:hypothetical protein
VAQPVVIPQVSLAPPPVIITPTIGLSGPITDLDNPEPATSVLFVSGAAALWLWRRKKRAKA